MLAVEGQGLAKRFGPVVALDGVGLAVKRGEVAAVLGPNGSGKSTLIRILATIVVPDQGRATLAGHDVLRHPRRARGCFGLVTGDQRSWYWRLSGRRNLRFFATLYGLSRATAEARIGALLDEVGMTADADRPMTDYSSGMRVRVGLARALLADPEVLLLDEPTASLDAEAVERFRALVAQRADERGTAVVLATHDLADAAALATHTLVLRRGSVVARRERAQHDELEDLMLSLAR